MTIERKMGMGIAGQPSGGAANVADVFSTYLYTGTGANRSIVNGIDLAGEGGMVWFKDRNTTNDHMVFDTERGVNKYIFPSYTGAEGTAGGANALKAFNSDGFDLGSFGAAINPNNQPIVSWTFRKAPKFFDVVTYTGNGANRTIAHSLDGPVGMMVVKATSKSANWNVYHKSLTADDHIFLNKTNAKATSTLKWNDTDPTDSVFSLGTHGDVNTSGSTYVAYLFADNSAEDADDQMIKCGSYTGAGAHLNINLGWEPQFVLIKCTSHSANWVMFDNMRGLPVDGNAKDLRPNATDTEGDNSAIGITSTGFLARNGVDGQINANGRAYIYMAIRAPMMKEPSAGTEVFSSGTWSGGGGATLALDADISTDLFMFGSRSGVTKGTYLMTRMLEYPRANDGYASLSTSSTAAETDQWSFRRDTPNNSDEFYAYQDSSGNWSSSGSTYYAHGFKRAKGFFDVVAYTGTGSPRTLAHSLGVVPEMIVCKSRSTTSGWQTYHKTTGNTKYLYWNQTYQAQTSSSVWNNTTPTDSVFTVGTGAEVNTNAATYIAYLFASVSGVSKVGSYTGNGSSQTLNCGFAAGARFILIKRTDVAGDWFYWDTTRGIVAGNDPHLSLNTTAAEVTTDDSVDPDNSGFIVNQVAATNINVSSVTYIYLAIA